MLTITQQYELLRRSRSLRQGLACPEHDFTTEHPDHAKRLRMGEVICARCQLIVPVIGALLYSIGRRHGAANGLHDE